MQAVPVVHAALLQMRLSESVIKAWHGLLPCVGYQVLVRQKGCALPVIMLLGMNCIWCYTELPKVT